MSETSEPEHFGETRRWLRYANEDLTAAQLLAGERAAAPREACYMAQQAAEKALEAVLVFLQVDFPLTHDLDLLRTLIPEKWRTREEHPNLGRLTAWAVQARYPGSWSEATAAEASAAVKSAEAITVSVRTDLEGRGLTAEAAS